jgi:hypothetical protein
MYPCVRKASIVPFTRRVVRVTVRIAPVQGVALALRGSLKTLATVADSGCLVLA